MQQTFEQRSREYREYIESYLKEHIAADQQSPQQELFDAMRYSLLAGGKRLRPILYLSSAECAAVTGKRRLPLLPPWK